MQDEVARAVVSALQVKLVANPGDRVVEQGTENLDAYNAYLQGLFFWNKRTAADLERAARFFQQAIAADSGYAKAWAGLAATYVLFIPSEYDVKGLSAVEALDRSEHAARKALALDERSAEAYAALGNALEQRGQVEGAGEAFRRAIAVDPRYPTARQWYGDYLTNQGQLKEGLEQMLIAQRLDPLSLVIAVETGELYDAMGRRADALAQYERVLEKYPSTYLTYMYAGDHLLINRDFARAAGLIGSLVIALGADSATGRRIAEGIENPSTRDATLHELGEKASIPNLRVAAYRALGDDEGAITAFERCVDGPLYEKIYLSDIRAELGPELSARPRAQAAYERFVARLRTRQ